MKKLILTGAMALVLTGCATSPDDQSQAPQYPNGSGAQIAQGQSVHSQGIAGQDSFNGQTLANGTTPTGFTSQMIQEANQLPTTLYFRFDSTKLSNEAKNIANENVNFLLKNPSAYMMIAGSTDPIGSQDYNFHLGQKRANAVKDYMLQQGVSPHQLCTLSYGDTKLVSNPEQYQGKVNQSFYHHRQAVIDAYTKDRRANIVYGQTCTGSDQNA